MICLLEMAAARSSGGRRVVLATVTLALVFTFSQVPRVWSSEKPAGSASGDCVDVKEPGSPLGRDAKARGNELAAIAAMAVSPDGSRLAIAQEDRTALLCRADNGQIVHRFGAHQDAVTAVAFSPDGQRLATASFDGNVRIWRIGQPDSQPQILHRHDNWVLDVAFSPDGRWLASCGYDKSVRLWDAATGTLSGEFSGHTAGVRTVAFSPDGKLLASAGSDRTIKLWSLADGRLAAGKLTEGKLADHRELATLSGHEGAIRKVAFSPDGKTLASASEDTKVKLWDVEGRRERATLDGHEQIVWTLAFSPGGATLATAGMDKTIRLWDPDKAKLRRAIKQQSDSLTGLCFSPDGRGLFAAGDGGSLMFWQARALPLPPLAQFEEAGNFVLLSPDGKWCVSGVKDGVLQVRDMASGDLQHKLSAHQGAVRCAAFSADSRQLATGGGDKKLRIWNASAWAARPQTIKTKHKQITAVAWTPDGRLVSSGEDRIVRVWRPGEAAQLLRLEKQDLAINRLAVSPDGTRLATASGDPADPLTPGEVKIWDLESGRLSGQLGPHLGSVRGVLYTPDGRNLVTYGAFPAVRVWSTASLHEVSAWSVANFTDDICLTAHGSTLAVGDATGGIELRSLSAATGRSFKGHQKAVLAVTSSTDGTLLATAASDGKIAFWRTGLTSGDAQTSASVPAPRTAAAMVAAWSEKAALSSSKTKSNSAASK